MIDALKNMKTVGTLYNKSLIIGIGVLFLGGIGFYLYNRYKSTYHTEICKDVDFNALRSPVDIQQKSGQIELVVNRVYNFAGNDKKQARLAFAKLLEIMAYDIDVFNYAFYYAHQNKIPLQKIVCSCFGEVLTNHFRNNYLKAIEIKNLEI